MDQDFPAAHSMDSCWFAVDRDGFVACFDTGEAGAMPDSGYQGDEAYALRDILVRDLPAGDVLFDPAGFEVPGASGGPAQLQPTDQWPTLVFLTSLSPVQSDIEAGRATAVRATEGYAVIFPRMTAEQARRLTASGAVRTSEYYFEDHGGGSRALAGHGIYEYSHLCENWTAGPYGRRFIPARPIHVDQLPPNIRRNLKETQFRKLSFAESVRIQPVEHMECQAWDSTWLGLDGVRRTFTGEELPEDYDGD